MKKKLMLSLMLLMSTSSFATVWDYATVKAAGKSASGYYVILTESSSGEFSDRVFRMKDGIDAGGLAVALAAQSNRKQVKIRSNIDVAEESEFPEIIIIYATDRAISE